MSVSNFKVSVPSNQSGGSYEALPEDVYQCVIDRIEPKTGTKYMSNEPQDQLLFYMRPLGVDEQYKNNLLFYQTTTSFFNGKSSNAKAELSPSKLFTVLKTVYAFYDKELDIKNLDPKKVDDPLINGMEGKQVMAVVKVNANGKNKITDLMVIKKELKTEDSKKSVDNELEEILAE